MWSPVQNKKQDFVSRSKVGKKRGELEDAPLNRALVVMWSEKIVHCWWLCKVLLVCILFSFSKGDLCLVQVKELCASATICYRESWQL